MNEEFFIPATDSEYLQFNSIWLIVDKRILKEYGFFVEVASALKLSTVFSK